MKLLVLLMLAITLMAGIPVPCKPQERMIVEKSLDMDTKTLKSWLRTLNSKYKQEAIGVYLTEAQIVFLIKCIRVELESRKLQGKMS